MWKINLMYWQLKHSQRVRNKDRNLNTFPRHRLFTHPTPRPVSTSPPLMSVPTAPPAALNSSHFFLAVRWGFLLVSHLFGAVCRGLGHSREPLCPAPAAPHGSLSAPHGSLTVAPGLRQPLAVCPGASRPPRPLTLPQTEPGQAEYPTQISHNSQQHKPSYLSTGS